jgi:transcription elongation factor Elf1
MSPYCPRCGSRSVRLAMPESLDTQAYRCNECAAGWSVIVHAGRRAQNVQRWTCQRCGAHQRVFLEQTKNATHYRCATCDQIVAVAIRTVPIDTI